MEFQNIREIAIERGAREDVILCILSDDLCFRIDFREYAAQVNPITPQNMSSWKEFRLENGMKFSHDAENRMIYLTRPNDDRGIMIVDGIFNQLQIHASNLHTQNVPPPRNFRLSFRKECKQCGKSSWRPARRDLAQVYNNGQG